MRAEPQPPDDGKQQQRRAVRTDRAAGHMRCGQQRQADHAIGPDGIDEADIFDGDRNLPEDQHRHHDRSEVDEKGLHKNHQTVSSTIAVGT